MESGPRENQTGLLVRDLRSCRSAKRLDASACHYREETSQSDVGPGVAANGQSESSIEDCDESRELGLWEHVVQPNMPERSVRRSR